MHAIAFGAPHVPFTMQNGHLYMPISKVDKARRMVWGVAQIEDPEPDTQDDIVDYQGSLRAFERWAGNVREMHGEVAAGRAIKIIGDPVSKQILVGTYISEGAEPTWKKILDGTLRGYSIGGKVLKDHYSIDPKTRKRVHHIMEYQLDELSLVDTPANSKCRFTAIEKRASGLVLLKRHSQQPGVRTAASYAPIAADFV